MKKFILFAVMLVMTSLTIGANQAVYAGVNDFTISNYEIDYYLDRTANGRSTLKTVEIISARFPDTNQNHGIERAVPTTYDGHSTNLKIESVVDQNNQAHSYTTYTSNDNLVIRIGNADTYVHGLVTYKLTYTQQDVTKYFSDSNSDEFYWDTNGTEWRVPIESLSVRLHIPNNLQKATNGKSACYKGASGSTDTCDIQTSDGEYRASAAGLYPYQNLSIAIGFKPNTFSAYEPSLGEKFVNLLVTIAFLSVPLAIILIIWFSIRYHRRSNRLGEIHPIVPEYIPPKDVSVATAAAISRKSQRSFSAQLLDFAVRHYIRIYETQKKSLFRSAKYELEIIKDIRTLKQEEQEVLSDIFDETTVGSKLDMSTMKNNASLASRLQDNPGKLNKSITGAYGLRARDDVQSRWFKRGAFVTLLLALLTLSPVLLIPALWSFVSSLTLKPLTDKGLALSRYLKGLELYIKVAETDRLRMLQSPEGAAKVGKAVNTNDTKLLITLYERVLPYAVIFGLEKEWNSRLGEYYQAANQTPSWFHGSSPMYNAAAFNSAITSFSSAATYSRPSSSSSSGSSGGGFSGGGGGGGGGGGW